MQFKYNLNSLFSFVFFVTSVMGLNWKDMNSPELIQENDERIVNTQHRWKRLNKYKIEGHKNSSQHPKLKVHDEDFDPFIGIEKFENYTTQAYPSTQSGMDRFFFGMIIGMSDDPDNPNICILMWNDIYYSVVAIEEIYNEWE